MGKRSAFPRLPQDAYTTPFEAVEPLLPHHSPRTRFIEPCMGKGRLVEHLTRAGHVLVGAFDLPDDARVKRYDGAGRFGCFITNPPWWRPTLHLIIANLSDQAPTWLLIDADWAHTRRAVPYLARLRLIVSVGRVKWMPGTQYTGKDNCCWHLFNRPTADAAIRFVGRTTKLDRPEAQPLLEAAE